MEAITFLVDFILHVDVHLQRLIQEFGFWTYLIIFLIVFCETGLVVMPFLPGDSLLFAVGVFAAHGAFDVTSMFVLLLLAAVGGDTVNYWVGYLVGPKVFREDTGLFRREYLERTARFYERYGGKTIILARFIPILRTFAPFVAGVGRMDYRRFVFYNVAGGVAWVAIFVFGGYLFHDLPIVKERFNVVILAIIALSLLPGVVEYLRHRTARP